MLSYRHAFHAGNFADVLKHVILIRIIEHLKKKEKPFHYIDTHAGPGRYNFQNDYALKNREFDNGIGMLWQRSNMPSCVAEYVEIVRQFNHGKSLILYPGSPAIVSRIARKKDKLALFELHSTEIIHLNAFFKKDQRVRVEQGDGLIDSLKLLPPIEHRGLVLIDPSYEIKSDYTDVKNSLVKMVNRFATGTYALWYPVVDRNRIQRLELAIQASGIKNIQLFELSIEADSRAPGMTGSGMIVVNPPWTLANEMRQALPWLAELLSKDGNGAYRVHTLVGE